jgi:uncharacterized membrane protein YgcG
MTFRRNRARAAAELAAASGAVVALVASVVWAALSFPALTGRVVDEAGLLTPAERQSLTDMLAAYEQKTTNQVVVVTLKSLQGTSIEDYGYQLGRHWGIGQKGKDNGALLIVAPNEHKVRIEVGYGLEGELTDAASKLIIENIIVPAFKSGRFGPGIVAGTGAILKVLSGDETGAEMRGTKALVRPILRETSTTIAWLAALAAVFLVALFTHLRLNTRSKGYGYVDAVAATRSGRATGPFVMSTVERSTDASLGRLLGGIRSVALMDADRRVVCGHSDGTLVVWDLEDGDEIHRLSRHTNHLRAIAVVPNSQLAVTAAADRTLRYWDLEKGTELDCWDRHDAGVSGIAWASEERRFFLAGDDGSVRLWNLMDGKDVWCAKGHEGRTLAVDADPVAKRGLSGGTDRILRLWDLEDGKEIRRFEGHQGWIHALALADDGRRAVSASSDWTLRLWDLESGQEVGCLRDHKQKVCAVAVGNTPDVTAVSGSWDCTALVWDLSSGKRISCFEAHQGEVYAVAMTADGTRAVSGSSDGTLRLWDLGTGKEIRRFEARVADVEDTSFYGFSTFGGGDFGGGGGGGGFSGGGGSFGGGGASGGW